MDTNVTPSEPEYDSDVNSLSDLDSKVDSELDSAYDDSCNEYSQSDDDLSLNGSCHSSESKTDEPACKRARLE
jgi:hypothetical protein